MIEILSPEDTQSEITARFHDYEARGVQHVIHMDPEQYLSWRYTNGSLIRTDFEKLALPGRPDLPFDSRAVFAQLRAEIAEYEGNE